MAALFLFRMGEGGVKSESDKGRFEEDGGEHDFEPIGKGLKKREEAIYGLWNLGGLRGGPLLSVRKRWELRWHFLF